MPDRKTVLVIEDDDLVRFSITAYLEDSGFAIIEARDGQEGVALASQGQADLVITDLHMPGMNGLEVVNRIRGQFPALPVIVMTGAGDAASAAEASAQGAQACLFKPLVKMELLVQTIRSLLAGHGASREVF
jgi:CheY-like chemotaxis protein